MGIEENPLRDVTYCYLQQSFFLIKITLKIFFNSSPIVFNVIIILKGKINGYNREISVITDKLGES